MQHEFPIETTNINNNNREKNLKLLHLDHLQRAALDTITTKFLNRSKIGIHEVVESFKTYVLSLVQLAASSTKYICDHNGTLTASAENYLKKFTDAILICSKYRLNYHKIFSVLDVRDSLIQASQAQNNLTSHYINELEYRLKIATYSMLESDNTKVINYLDNIKDFYFRSLATVNPPIAKRAFIDQIVDMLNHTNNHTISDISDMVNKYATYLGKAAIDHNKIEELVHKYSGVSMMAEEGLLHAAKIEVFKVLEGL